MNEWRNERERVDGSEFRIQRVKVERDEERKEMEMSERMNE